MSDVGVTRPGDPEIRLGISMCLLGEPVRYDAGHKLDRFLAQTWGEYVQWVPVCPEVEAGLPVPREPMQLEGDPDAPRLIGLESRADYTGQMRTWTGERVGQLAALGLSGLVLKSRSPSCGLVDVKVFQDAQERTGMGLFARAMADRFPLLPMEEEVRLGDMGVRESFIGRVLAYYRWTKMMNSDASAGGLVRFHTAHKLTLMAHSRVHYDDLGRLVAGAGKLPWDELTSRYGRMLMEGLAVPATRGKHVNVLQHVMGYVKKDLSSEDKGDLLGVIEEYRQGRVPLIVPLVLLKYHLSRHPVPEWVRQQVYLYPSSKELMLRYHV